MKPTEAFKMEETLKQALIQRFPDIRVNVYRLDGSIIGFDAISEEFKSGSMHDHLVSILSIMELKMPKEWQTHCFTVCPVTLDMFNRKLTPDWYEEGEY